MEFPIAVNYKGNEVGHFYADIMVEDCIILEIKAVRELGIAHELQLVNYLRSTGVDVGLLINYGGEKFQIKRKYRVYRKRN